MLNLKNLWKLSYLMQKNRKYSTWLTKEIGKIEYLGIVILATLVKVIELQEVIIVER